MEMIKASSSLLLHYCWIFILELIWPEQKGDSVWRNVATWRDVALQKPLWQHIAVMDMALPIRDDGKVR